MAVHGRAFGVGANLARSAPPFSPVVQSGCAAQASATCISGNSIRAPMVNSGEFKPSAVESSIQRSSHQQVSRRGQEVCIFQGGPSSGSHCQFGRRRSGEVIFAAGSQTCPATDCSSTCRSTFRRLHAVHRVCEEAGPDCRRASEKESSPLQSNVWSTSSKKLQGLKLFLPQFHHFERWWRPPSQQAIPLQSGLQRFRGCAPRMPDSRHV